MIKDFLFKNTIYKFNNLAASINLKPKEFNVEPGTKCLCLAPHPDDESIGMGGLLSLYPKNFEVILLTDGRKGIKDLSEQETITVRENEFKCAMNVNEGVSSKFLRIKDKQLIDAFEIFKTIDFSLYDYIFLPNIIDQHPDHKAVSILLKNAIASGAKLKSDVQICFYEVWSALGLVNAFVDISEVIERKKAMISCYTSQTSQKNYDYHALGLNQFRGMYKDKKFVEAFCIIDINNFKKICNLY